MSKPLLCVTVTAATTAELRQKRDAVADADLIELRLDTVRDTEDATRAIEKAAGPGFSVTDWRRMNSGLAAAGPKSVCRKSVFSAMSSPNHFACS